MMETIEVETVCDFLQVNYDWYSVPMCNYRYICIMYAHTYIMSYYEPTYIRTEVACTHPHLHPMACAEGLLFIQKIPTYVHT